MDKAFSSFPKGVSLIGEEDFRCLKGVNLLIISWPCQSHSCVGAQLGLDDQPLIQPLFGVDANHTLMVQTSIHST